MTKEQLLRISVLLRAKATEQSSFSPGATAWLIFSGLADIVQTLADEALETK